jgi:NAD(P)-dependent dehydrogenase (short-subunit alcohol dehydrogenase family)
MKVALAARTIEKLEPLKRSIGASVHGCDATEPDQVQELFSRVEHQIGQADLVVYNPSDRIRGPITSLDPVEVLKTLRITAFGGFLVAQAALKFMLPRGSGSLFFTGASASMKGYPESAPFAMGKFALRGLAQSLAREVGPRGVHVAHFVIDGGILKGPDDPRAQQRGEDGMLLPDHIAEMYLQVHRQHRSAWTFELDLRPWVERF